MCCTSCSALNSVCKSLACQGSAPGYCLMRGTIQLGLSLCLPQAYVCKMQAQVPASVLAACSSHRLPLRKLLCQKKSLTLPRQMAVTFCCQVAPGRRQGMPPGEQAAAPASKRRCWLERFWLEAPPILHLGTLPGLHSLSPTNSSGRR